jgi:hypothetical protein
MTDLERLTETFAAIGVHPAVEEEPEPRHSKYYGLDLPAGTTLRIGGEDSPKVGDHGLMGFYFEFVFDTEGNLVSTGGLE